MTVRATLAAIALLLAAQSAPVAVAHGGDAPRPVVIAIDGGHHNHHTRDGRFRPFAELLQGQRFRVQSIDTPFTTGGLAGVDVLVVANALHASNVDAWRLPTPSAFTEGEIAAVADWVGRGGALLLIADHFPFPGAAADLAAAFGFRFANGFALGGALAGIDRFSTTDGTLRGHAITRGRDAGERVTTVTTFTGSAFTAPPAAEPLIVLPPGSLLLLPEVAWQFDEATQALDAGGSLQGAVLRHGRGRVAVFAEAAMFTAQVVDGDPPQRVGFNADGAEGNAQFVVNILRWLAGQLAD